MVPFHLRNSIQKSHALYTALGDILEDEGEEHDGDDAREFLHVDSCQVFKVDLEDKTGANYPSDWVC